MGLRLILIRHAKSDWGDPFAGDHDRTLNPRGRASATAIGQWLARNGHLPDEVLSSDAVRTRETAELILKELPVAPEVRFLPQLYHASADAMLATLQRATAPVVALIGHNPGIGALACGVVAARPDHPRYADYPTAATAIIDFDAPSWDKIARGTGRIVDFVVPREVMQD